MNSTVSPPFDKFQFLAVSDRSNGHEGDETRLVALEPAGADGFDASAPGEVLSVGTWADEQNLDPAESSGHAPMPAVPWQ